MKATKHHDFVGNILAKFIMNSVCKSFLMMRKDHLNSGFVDA
jgi:hypothetical protein